MPNRISRRAALITLAGVGLLVALADGSLARLIDALRPAPPMPPIVPRDQWGALPPDHSAINEYGVTDDPKGKAWYVYTAPLADVYNTVVIHHTAALLASNETMLGVQKLHMNVNHWADIGYHYAIDNHGVIYAGRDIHARGASVAGHNTGVIGVVLMGDFVIDQPLAVQLSALQMLVNWLAYTYTLTHLAGHDEFNPGTLCPGVNLAAHLDQLAQAAGLQRGTGGYVAPV